MYFNLLNWKYIFKIIDNLISNSKYSITILFLIILVVLIVYHKKAIFLDIDKLEINIFNWN